VIVGIQSEPLNGAVGSLHIVTTLAGKTNSDEVLALSALLHEVKRLCAMLVRLERVRR
jgi:hypothetical protein